MPMMAMTMVTVLLIHGEKCNDCQQRFYAQVGLTKAPVTWSDEEQEVYEVYVKGQLEMGGFVNLMERVEYIGKEMVYKHGNG